MLKTIITTIISTLLLISIATYAPSIELVKSEPKTWTTDNDKTAASHIVAASNREWQDSHFSEEDAIRHHSTFFEKLSFDKLSEWRDSAYMDKDSVELVIGISDAYNCGQLTELAELWRCCLTDKIVINNESVAIIVDVPLNAVSTFVTALKTTAPPRYIEPNIIFNASIVPNDYSWRRQWGPSKIEADYAWNWQMGNASVLVAIIDTGVDWNHPDLAANYVPLGYDWVNNDDNPMDDHGHGTHCAGIIAAKFNNGIGTAGLAQTNIMAEKALDSLGIGLANWLANAIIHAVDQGAKIISMSLGTLIKSELVHDAVKYAYDNDVLLVGAAGNEATDRMAYPAAFEEVIAVTATDQLDAPAFFTNFGDWIELAAPGVDIYSTLWNDTYDYMSGTSMACPHVAGVAALVWSQFPNLSQDQVRLRLRQTADDLGDLGFDQYYGYGRINARAAVVKDLPEHDVLIEYWELPQIEELGRTLKINATVLNFGKSSEAEITIQLLTNDSLVDNINIGSLESNMSQKVSLSWSPIVEGIYNVTIYMLPVSHENTLRNNVFSAYVSLRIPRVILVPEDSPTIKSAVNVAYPGDTVLVSSGTYYEHASVTKPLKLLGKNSDTTIINGNGTETVLRISTTDNVFISGFSVKNGSIGILLYNSDNISLRNNELIDNDDNLRVSGRSLYDFIQDIDASNEVNGKSIHYLVNQKTKEVTGEAGYVGLVNSTNIIVKDLNLNERILVSYTTHSFIENITVSNASCGVQLCHSSNNTVRKSTLLNNTYGIYLGGSRSNKIISNNIALNGHTGIHLGLAFANEIDSNTITHNSRGIYLEYSANNLFMNNTMINNHYNFGVQGSFLPHFIQDIHLSNTVNGRTVCYLVNQDSVVIDPPRFPNAGYLGVVNSTNLTIQNLILTSNNIQGVLFAYTNNSTITGLNVSQNNVGIYLYESNNNEIDANIVSDNWHGIELEGSDNNNIGNNIMESNGEAGILLYMSGNNMVAENYMHSIGLLALGIESSTENTIIENEMSNNYVAMALWGSGYNSIYANHLMDNEFGVMLIMPSDDNTIYHNSFVNNSMQVFNLGTRNIWDDGYPSGGNYWSDHAGNDSCRGPRQNETGSDGIVDTPYIIDADNHDRYPLMNPWITETTTGDVNHDGKVDILDIVAIASIYGYKEGYPNWNPFADIAPPYGVIDILDLVTCTYHYGEKYP